MHLSKENYDSDDERYDSMCRSIYHTFNTDSGKMLLELLSEQFLKSPVANPGKSPYYAYFREGENNIIRQFMNCIKEYENPTKKIEDEGIYD